MNAASGCSLSGRNEGTDGRCHRSQAPTLERRMGAAAAQSTEQGRKGLVAKCVGIHRSWPRMTRPTNGQRDDALLDCDWAAMYGSCGKRPTESPVTADLPG